jgi:hypothetical protein
VFVERYAFLLPPERMQRLAGSEHTDVCKVILAYFQIKATMYQVRQRKLMLTEIGRAPSAEALVVHFRFSW